MVYISEHMHNFSFFLVEYQILRQESAPFLTIQTPNFIKFEEISAHFNGSGNNTISSYYRPSGLLHSNSAPPDILWNGETRRWMSRGMDDDTERDGPISKSCDYHVTLHYISRYIGRSNLKRTPSAQYVSNGKSSLLIPSLFTICFHDYRT